MTFVILMALILSLQIQKQHVLTHPPEVGCAPLPLSPLSSSLPRAAPPLPHTAVPRPAPGLSACLHYIWALAFTNSLPSRSSSPFPPTVKLPGLHIWRVEKLKPVPVAPENYGIFFSGDSYLVLHNGPEELSHLHLWIGKGESWEDWWWGVLAQAGRGAGLGLTGNLPRPQASSHPGTSRGPAPCWLCTSTPCLESGPCSTESHRAMSLTSS